VYLYYSPRPMILLYAYTYIEAVPQLIWHPMEMLCTRPFPCVLHPEVFRSMPITRQPLEAISDAESQLHTWHQSSYHLVKMSEEAFSRSSTPLLDTIDTSTLTNPSTSSSLSGNASSWRKTLKIHNGDVGGIYELQFWILHCRHHGLHG
jgi:hypothetical protein